MNRGVAQHSPWISFLRQKGTQEQISKLLREAGAEYRALYGVKPKYKTAAERRKTKIERAIAAIQDADIQNRLKAEFGDKYNASYVADALNALQKELDHLNAIIEWQVAPQQPPPQRSTVAKKGHGYGLTQGLGYGYFY
jgi:hypothetical protein